MAVLWPLVLILLKPILQVLHKTPIGKFLPHPESLSRKGQKTKGKEGAHHGKEGSNGSPAMSSSCLSSRGDVVEVVTEDQFQEVLQSNQVVFVEYTASWCKPCKTIAPLFEELGESFARVGIRAGSGLGTND